MDDGYEELKARIADSDAGSIAISVISYAEVAYGTYGGKPPSPEVLEAFIDAIPMVPFDEAAAREYARLPFKRARFDRLLAAHALSTRARPGARASKPATRRADRPGNDASTSRTPLSRVEMGDSVYKSPSNALTQSKRLDRGTSLRIFVMPCASCADLSASEVPPFGLGDSRRNIDERYPAIRFTLTGQRWATLGNAGQPRGRGGQRLGSDGTYALSVEKAG